MVPTLVLHGKRDPGVDAAGVRRFFGRPAGREKQVVVLTGADYCAHLETTHDSWIAAIVNFRIRMAAEGDLQSANQNDIKPSFRSAR